MALRLWGIMMILVLLSISFMWVVQIRLFEQNYINTAVNDAQSAVAPIEAQLRDQDIIQNTSLFYQLGAIVNGKIMLINGEGELIQVYSYSHPIDLDNDPSMVKSWNDLRNSSIYQKVLDREPFEQLNRFDTPVNLWLKIGFPTKYHGEDAYLILHHSLSSLYSLQEVNRSQLIHLSILLTLAASLLTALLAHQFTKPILTIKHAIDQLAKGEFTATPSLSRSDELGQLSDSVGILSQELQKLDVLRKEVIANVSHELRSPLALIGGYAEMVKDITWQDEEKRNEDLNLIISESRRMTEMVNDILDYSQLQSGCMNLKKDWYNLYEIVESEVGNCKKTADKNHLFLHLEASQTDCCVYLDALKISQVIRNLIYNAVNHTQDGETITVRLERSGERILVSVINPGDPIPEEDRAIIWERYQRSQHQGGRKQGTGIGLSIVSTILKAHEMEYGVDCRKGLTVFWFKSPLLSKSAPK